MALSANDRLMVRPSDLVGGDAAVATAEVQVEVHPATDEERNRADRGHDDGGALEVDVVDRAVVHRASIVPVM